MKKFSPREMVLITQALVIAAEDQLRQSEQAANSGHPLLQRYFIDLRTELLDMAQAIAAGGRDEAQARDEAQS